MALRGAGSHRALRGFNIRASEGNSRAVRCCNLSGVETQMAEESSRYLVWLCFAGAAARGVRGHSGAVLS